MRVDIQRWLLLATAILGLQACRAPAPIDPASMPEAGVATTATDTAAVDATPDTVSPATPTTVPEVDLWDALRAGFALTDDLPLGQPRFARALAWITNQSDLLSDMEPRAQRYLPYLVQQVAKRNLPLEIALL